MSQWNDEQEVPEPSEIDFGDGERVGTEVTVTPAERAIILARLGITESPKPTVWDSIRRLFVRAQVA